MSSSSIENQIEIYKNKIIIRVNHLLNSGKIISDFDFFDISKIFEYMTAIELMKTKNDLFLVYEDIDPVFKESNGMTINDSGIDVCNSSDTIVQCKLRSKSINLHDLATFFSSQNIFNEDKKIFT